LSQPDPRQLALEALARLSSARADDRDSWVKVGMALHAVDPGLLPYWITFSQQSAKFKPGECEKLWKGFKPDKTNSLGLGSLIHWAREDSGNSSFPAGTATPAPRLARPAPVPVPAKSKAIVFPTVEAAVMAIARRVGGKVHKTWRYERTDGTPAFYIARVDLPGTAENGKPEKTFRPVTPVERGYEIRDPEGPLPLYRLPALTAAKLVCVVEGEKAADAGVLIGLCTTTSAHGAQSAAQTDWTPVAGKHVRLFPDNDPDGAKYVLNVCEILETLSPPTEVCIVELSGLSSFEDLFDWVETRRNRGLPNAEIVAELDALVRDRAVSPAVYKARFDLLASPTTKSTNKQATRRRQGQTALKSYRPFPTDLLPGPVRAFVDSAAVAIGCDTAYVVVPLIGALASAIGNTRRLKIKRKWSEPAILWLLLIADSGTQKSPAIDAGIGFLTKRQQQALRQYGVEMAEYWVAYALYEKAQGAWKKKSGDDEPPTPPAKPVANRFFTSDTTVEAIAVLLEAQPRGLLLYRDELSGWFGSFNQYKGGRGGDEAHWLEMHRGASMTIDRKGNGSKVIFVPRAAVSITGGIQPHTLKRVLGSDRQESGMAARFLYAMPSRRRRKWTDAEIPVEVETALSMVFDNLYALRFGQDAEGQPAPIEVEMDAAAKKLWVQFYNEHAEEHADLEGDLSYAWAKLEGYAARLALVIHCVRMASGDHTAGEHLDASSIRCGIEISRWFGHEARRVYAFLQESEDAERLRRLVERVELQGGEVTVRDWQNLCSHPTADAARAELEQLVESGNGEWIYPASGPRGGRPVQRLRLVAKSNTPSSSAETGVSSVSESMGPGSPASLADTAPPPVAGPATVDGDELTEATHPPTDEAVAVPRLPVPYRQPGAVASPDTDRTPTGCIGAGVSLLEDSSASAAPGSPAPSAAPTLVDHLHAQDRDADEVGPASAIGLDQEGPLA